MARGTTEKRRLIKFSNYSMCVTLPKWVIDQLEWEKGDVLTLSSDVKQGKITLYKDPKESTRTKSPSPSTPTTPSQPTAENGLEQVSEITEDIEPQKLRW
jgi:hypothetical protein